jgi:predicted kinase
MKRKASGPWNVVLSGYPRSGKTLLAKRLVADYCEFARVSVDELRDMLFNEAPPCRDEYILYSFISVTRDALLKRGYSVVIDSTAPDDTTRDFLLTSIVKDVNQLLVIFTVNRDTLIARSIEKCGDTSLVTAWDKRWEERRRECCLFKFKSNNMEEFEDYYDRLTELLESETHPFKPEFRPYFLPIKEIQKSFKNLLSKHPRPRN